MFHQLSIDGNPAVVSEQLGLLNAECTLTDGESASGTLLLNPQSNKGKLAALKIQMQHSLFNSQLGQGEDLLKAEIRIQNSSNEHLSLKIEFTTGAQPSERVDNQKIYIPVSATGLNKDKRLSELGSQDFHQECELAIGREDFACHYLEPMASIPHERKTKALMLAPVLDILNESSPCS